MSSAGCGLICNSEHLLAVVEYDLEPLGDVPIPCCITLGAFSLASPPSRLRTYCNHQRCLKHQRRGRQTSCTGVPCSSASGFVSSPMISLIAPASSLTWGNWSWFGPFTALSASGNGFSLAVIALPGVRRMHNGLILTEVNGRQVAERAEANS